MFGDFIYQQSTLFFLCLALLALWDLIWKSIGLWYSARNGQKAWFIAILIINSLGILPIIYLIWFKNKRSVRQATQVRVTGSHSKISRNKPKKKGKNK